MTLKSNMDRFIARQWVDPAPTDKPLKSNMDRFIDQARLKNVIIENL